MKKNWETKKLGEMCDLLNGFAFRSKDYIKSSNTMNFRMSQIRPGGGIDLDNNPKYLPDSFREKYKDYLLNNGDIVIAMTDMATETKILGVPTIIKTDTRKLLLNQRVGKLCKIDQTKIFIPFLRYVLISSKINDYYKSLGRGGLQINIGKQDILNARIPLPSLTEQKRIVIMLDETFTSLAQTKENAEKNLRNARELFESYLQSVFRNSGKEWEEKRLAEMCEIKPQKSGARTKLKDIDVVSFVPMKDLGIKKKWFVSVKERTLKEVEGSYTYFADRDVLLAKITPCFENGKLGIASNLKNGIGFGSSEFIVFRTNKGLSPEFLYYYLSRKEFRQEGSKRMMGAVGHKRVSKEFIEKSIIPIPVLLEQNRVVVKLDALSAETKKLEAVYQKKLTDLEELKKSILQKAFNGELVGGCS
ncbi:MAG TPA: restriction endonuclease subunit S [Atribacterota bacterium]|nr:restriction endonuclease subunit S [Atribacterota bacterium]